MNNFFMIGNFNQGWLNNLMSWTIALTGLQEATVLRLFYTILFLLILLFFRTLFLYSVWRNVKDVEIRYRWRKGLSYTCIGIAVLVISRIWFQGIDAILNILGLLAAGLLIVLGEYVKSLASWGYALWVKPFQIGDRIKVKECTGDVIDIRPFQFSLMEIDEWVGADQYTGRIVHFPNHYILSEKIHNYTKGFNFIWDEITITLSFESDWDLASQKMIEITKKATQKNDPLVQEAVKAAGQEYPLMLTHLEPAVYPSISERGVVLGLRYLVKPKERRILNAILVKEILKAFSAHPKIAFAYPTTRFVRREKELGYPEGAIQTVENASEKFEN